MIYDQTIIDVTRGLAARRLIDAAVGREDDRWLIEVAGYEKEEGLGYEFVPRFLLLVTFFYDGQILKYGLVTADGLPDEDVPSADLQDKVWALYHENTGEYDFDARIFDLDQECELEFGRELTFKKKETA